MNQDQDARNKDWEARIAEVWRDPDALPPEAFVAAVDALAEERPDGDPAALFERACARDTAGLEADAEGYYRAALATAQLDPYRRARAVIQLASTLRLLGRLDESEALLTEQVARNTRVIAAGNAQPVLHDEARAFLALTYAAQGRHAQAAGLALIALAPHLTRYRRSVTGNATELLGNS